MPFALNSVDGRKVYYENDGGDGPPIVFLGGFASSTVTTRFWPVAQALGTGYRQIYIDHRGHGQSDKPHEPEAYAMRTRVADIVAVIDNLGLEKVHLVAASYGARLAYGATEHARERVWTLTAYGMTPYRILPDGSLVAAISRATQAMSKGGGMEPLVQELSAFLSVDGPVRDLLMANDPIALAASWTTFRSEGDLSNRLSSWTLPCLIYAGTKDDMFEPSKRAANEIPGAIFVELPGETHFGGYMDADSVAPLIRKLIEA